MDSICRVPFPRSYGNKGRPSDQLNLFITDYYILNQLEHGEVFFLLYNRPTGIVVYRDTINDRREDAK